MHAAAEPHLELAPYELEPGRRANRDGEPFRFSALWFGKKQKFVGQLVGAKLDMMLFFGLEHESWRGNFVLAKHNLDAWESQGSYLHCEPMTYRNHWDLKDDFAHLSPTSWGRLFYLNEDLSPANQGEAKWRLFLSGTGWGQWIAMPQNAGKKAIFQWRTVPVHELITMPPLELLAWLKRDLSHPKGAFTLSRRFAVLDSQEKREFLYPLTRGTYAQWRHLTQLFLLSRSYLQRFNRPVWFKIEVDGKQNSPPQIQATPDESPIREDLTFAERFMHLTAEFFQPQLDAHLITHCYEAKRWNSHGYGWNFSLSRPTQHERLEALMQLREWLTDKATPDEIELLLND